MKYYVRGNDTYQVWEWFDQDLTTTVVTHLPTGLQAKGNALRYREDDYDESVGRTLAYYRALERLSKKIQRQTVRAL